MQASSLSARAFHQCNAQSTGAQQKVRCQSHAASAQPYWLQSQWAASSTNQARSDGECEDRQLRFSSRAPCSAKDVRWLKWQREASCQAEKASQRPSKRSKKIRSPGQGNGVFKGHAVVRWKAPRCNSFQAHKEQLMCKSKQQRSITRRNLGGINICFEERMSVLWRG